MTTKTLTRADIAESLYNKIGFSHADSFKIIESVFNLITEELATGRSVKISGFASFEPYSKRERIGRNPKNGKSYPISSRTVVAFRASPVLKKRLKPVA
ncbi:MAG: integration host factor subunit alpha [Alphaproteobacteria bacterium]|nr:integration host factor subunit alpha [Alphaproteobacteria bacterium]